MEQTQTPTKRYFVTSETGNKFPPEFINSRNRKYIVVRNCKVLFEKAIVDDVELHADFVKVYSSSNSSSNTVEEVLKTSTSILQS